MRSTIALFGPIASGKGVLSEILIQRGYEHFSYRDELIEQIDRRDLPLKRDSFQQVADSLRREFGNDMQARAIGERVRELRSQGRAEKVLVDSLRHPEDARWLKENLGAHIIAVTAPIETRFQRVLSRARSSDPMTKEGFIIADDRDRGIGQPEYGDQMEACLLLADHTIENTGSRRQLEDNLIDALFRMGIEGSRISKEGKR